MQFDKFLTILKSDIQSFRAGKISLNSLVRALETVEQIDVPPNGRNVKTEIMEATGELEIVNALILFDESRAGDLQADICELLESIESSIGSFR